MINSFSPYWEAENGWCFWVLKKLLVEFHHCLGALKSMSWMCIFSHHQTTVEERRKKKQQQWRQHFSSVSSPCWWPWPCPGHFLLMTADVQSSPSSTREHRPTLGTAWPATTLGGTSATCRPPQAAMMPRTPQELMDSSSPIRLAMTMLLQLLPPQRFTFDWPEKNRK